MPVSVETVGGKNLTIFHVSGNVTFYELRHAIDLYRRSGPTELELYDLSRWTGEPFTARDVENISNFLRYGAGNYRSTGKTAIVATEDIHFGNARAFLALTELDLPFKIDLFRSLGDAYAWLGLAP